MSQWRESSEIKKRSKKDQKHPEKPVKTYKKGCLIKKGVQAII